MNIVFRDFPGPGNECVFVEVEDDTGHSINAGEWRKRPDGLVELHLHPDTSAGASGQAVAQEPVAWFWRQIATGHTAPCMSDKHRDDTAASPDYEVFPVFAHPAPSAASVRAEAAVKLMEQVKPRRLFDEKDPNGYLESDREFFENNREVVAAFLESALQTPHASREGRADG